MPIKKKFNFESSLALKQLLAPHFDAWKAKHGGDLNELAERCGVSTAYLSHVRRYGRIPGRPVLILLSLNFKIKGEDLFRAAGISDLFPYDAGLQIARPEQDSGGLFSLKFNMEGFTETIRSVVRSEIRQRNVKDLLGVRPLKIGVNYLEYWLFDKRQPPADEKHGGFFPEFCKMLGVALQKEVELVYVPFSRYMEMLSNGQIDIFGPTMHRPNLPVQIQFSHPIFRLGVSAILRKRTTPGLEEVPIPKKPADLHDDRYKIVVTRNSLPHLLANTLLKRPDSSLILCSSDEEGVDRVMLRGLSHPAHVFVTNSVLAIETAQSNPKDLTAIFASKDNLIDLADNTLAIRPDWPEVLPTINDAIRFLQSRGGLFNRLVDAHKGPLRDVVDFGQ